MSHTKPFNLRGWSAWNSRQGMTLVEIMVVMTIVGLVTAGALSFFVQTSHMLFTSEQKLNINRDIRTVTNEMTDNARDANHFTLYSSFYDDFRNPPAGTEHREYRRRDGESGDFLLLIYYGEDPNPADSVLPPVERLVGYYRSIEDAEENLGPVRRFEVQIPPSQANNIVETLVPTVAEEDDFSKVIELSKGLANEKLFYNFRDRSIMVNGQIFHGNAAKRVTDTYNFTISPRG